MPKYRGRVDCYINPVSPDAAGGTSRNGGEMYVNLIQHISASMPDLGIEMLAWRFGTGGTGWNFWDQAGSTGRNSFACFRFHSASLGKFDCLIYENTGSAGNHTGSLYIDDSQTNGATTVYTNVGIAFAVHPSGSVTDTYPDTNGPWNGTYGNNADIKTSSVWKVTPEGKGAFFPRTNGILGANSGSRDNLVGLSYLGTAPLRMHTVLSEDSITIITDAGNDGSQKVIHFGPYLPRSGSTPYPESPYFFFTNGRDDAGSTPQPWGAFYGTTLGSLSRQNFSTNGAVSHPNLLTGSRIMANVTVTSNQALGYNNFVLSGSFDNYPVWVALKEGAEAGILGQVKHLSYGQGMSVNSVSTLSSSAAFGNLTLNEAKLLVPWGGDAPNTSPQVRTGRNFSIG